MEPDEAMGHLHARLRPSPDVIAQRMGDEVVIVHLVTNRMYELNRTAARLWELLGAGRDLPDIRNELLREFDVDPGQLDHELDGIVASLREADLLQVSEGQRQP